MRHLFATCVIVSMLSGCQTQSAIDGDPLLTSDDKKILKYSVRMLSSMERAEKAEIDAEKASMSPEERDDRALFRALMIEDPVELALKSASVGNYKLLGATMGYHAKAENASPAGFVCKVKPPMRADVYGCMPPPWLGATSKLMEEYNFALIQMPGFPNDVRDGCEMADFVVADMVRPRLQNYIKQGKYLKPGTELNEVTYGQFTVGFLQEIEKEKAAKARQ